MLRKILVCVILSALMAFSQARADTMSHDQHAAPPADTQDSGVSGNARLKVPDLELLDQDGEKGRFVSDFIGDRLTAVTFTYTTCTTACPILDGIFQQVQARLGEKLGKEVNLITLSIDPVTDIPPRLKAHAQKIKARPGWSFLTGQKQAVNQPPAHGIHRGRAAGALDPRQRLSLDLQGHEGAGPVPRCPCAKIALRSCQRCC
jgi:protein SCO1/2